jgi:hypothetical protein
MVMWLTQEARAIERRLGARLPMRACRDEYRIIRSCRTIFAISALLMDAPSFGQRGGAVVSVASSCSRRGSARSASRLMSGHHLSRWGTKQRASARRHRLRDPLGRPVGLPLTPRHHRPRASRSLIASPRIEMVEAAKGGVLFSMWQPSWPWPLTHWHPWRRRTNKLN